MNLNAPSSRFVFQPCLPIDDAEAGGPSGLVSYDGQMTGALSALIGPGRSR